MMTTHTAFTHREHASTTLPNTSGGVALAQVRSAVADLHQDGRHVDASEYALAALAAVLQQSSALELLVAKLRMAGIGKRSERTNAEQLALVLEALLKQAPQPDVNPESEAREDAALTQEIEQAESASPTPRRARQSWRTSAQVERTVHTHDVPETAQQCVTCGSVLVDLLSALDTAHIVLQALTTLKTVTVVARRSFSGFDARRATRRGLYVDEAAIMRREPMFVGDMLYGNAGVVVRDNRAFGRQVLVRTPRGLCAPSIFVDGQERGARSVDLDAIVGASNIRAIELYRREEDVPPEFNAPRGCGALLIWLRAAK